MRHNSPAYFEKKYGLKQKIYYHYTSLESFYNIVKDKSFRLTNLKSSNDKKELYYTKDNFYKDFKTVIANAYESNYKEWLCGLYLDLENHSDTFSEYCKTIKNGEAFALSLSQKRDNLTHWDRYAKGCTGICIGVNINAITALLKKYRMDYWGKNVIMYGDVIYDDNTLETIDSLFRDLYNALNDTENPDKEYLNSIYSNNSYTIPISIYSKISMFVKNKDFIDENETRLYYGIKEIKEVKEIFKLLRESVGIDGYKALDNRFNHFLENTHLNRVGFYMSQQRGIRSYKELYLKDIWGPELIPEIIIGPM